MNDSILLFFPAIRAASKSIIVGCPDAEPTAMTVPPSIDEVVPQIAPQADLDTTLVLRATRKLVDELQAAQAHGRSA